MFYQQPSTGTDIVKVGDEENIVLKRNQAEVPRIDFVCSQPSPNPFLVTEPFDGITKEMKEDPYLWGCYAARIMVIFTKNSIYQAKMQIFWKIVKSTFKNGNKIDFPLSTSCQNEDRKKIGT